MIRTIPQLFMSGFRASLRRMAILSCCTLTLVQASHAQSEDSTTLRVMGNQPIGKVNLDLAGVSLGGGAYSYLKPVYRDGLDRMGVRYVRLETITEDKRRLYDPETDSWNWEMLDKEIESIQATGAKIIANIFYTPRFLAYHNDNKYFYSYPKDYEAWERYVEAIVHHVNIEKGYGIQYWEIGNEPSGHHFFRAPMSEFNRFYESSARAVKRVDASALVGGFADNPQYPEHYRNLFKYCVEKALPFDFITYHWYGKWTRGGDVSSSLLYSYATALQGLGEAMLGKAMPIFLTEWNLVAEHGDQQQEKVAAYLGASLYWLQESPVEAAFFFRPQPYSRTQGSLLSKDGAITASGRVFKHFAHLATNRLNLVSVHPGVTGIASRDDHKISVLASRYDLDRSDLLECTISVPNHGLEGDYQVSVWLEDSSNATALGAQAPISQVAITAEPRTPIRATVYMQPFSVVYLQIEPVDGDASE